MNEFIECRGCGFVLYAKRGDEPRPKNWDSCPDCGGTDFQFTDE